MDPEMIQALVLLIAGSITTIAGAYFQSRWAAAERKRDREAESSARREQREADVAARREQREAEVAAQHERRHYEVHAAEFGIARDVCRRAMRITREYRGLSNSEGQGWPEFYARFVEILADLDLHASPQVRAAFERYIDQIDEHDFNVAIRAEPPDQYWVPIDAASKDLAQVIRDFLKNFRVGQA